MTFALDKNLGIPTDQTPWNETLAAAGINAIQTDNLVELDEVVFRHEPDIAYIPAADYHRMFAKGDHHYRGLAIATSKFTGLPLLRRLLVVRQDDPAKGTDYGYINKSCSSSYFPPALLLEKKGRKLNEFLNIMQVKPGPTWQGLVDAVVEKKVRSTMVLEGVWKTFPKNAKTTKIIGEYVGGKPPIVLVRQDLDETICKTLLDALLAWVPAWEAVYGSFKPYYYADAHPFFHDLDTLPPGM
jgi:hypothetical protein